MVETLPIQYPTRLILSLKISSKKEFELTWINSS